MQFCFVKMPKSLDAIAKATRLEAIATRFEAIATRVEAIAIWVDSIASRLLLLLGSFLLRRFCKLRAMHCGFRRFCSSGAVGVAAGPAMGREIDSVIYVYLLYGATVVDLVLLQLDRGNVSLCSSASALASARPCLHCLDSQASWRCVHDVPALHCHPSQRHALEWWLTYSAFVAFGRPESFVVRFGVSLMSTCVQGMLT